MKNFNNNFRNQSNSRSVQSGNLFCNPIVFQKPVINLQATGARIKQLMKQNGITARELQDLMGFQYIQAIYNWTRGENMPTIDNLVVLSEIFGVTINEIVVTDTVEIEVRKSA